MTPPVRRYLPARERLYEYMRPLGPTDAHHVRELLDEIEARVAPTPEKLDDVRLEEVIADALMDLRMDGPWFQSGEMTYQEAMRHYAVHIVAAIQAEAVDQALARVIGGAL